MIFCIKARSTADGCNLFAFGTNVGLLNARGEIEVDAMRYDFPLRDRDFQIPWYLNERPPSSISQAIRDTFAAAAQAFSPLFRNGFPDSSYLNITQREVGVGTLLVYQRVDLKAGHFATVEDERPHGTVKIKIPHLFLFAAFMVQPTLWMVSRFKMRSNLCANCGYDLRASVARCPECGTLIESEAGRHQREAYKSRILSFEVKTFAALVLLKLLAIYVWLHWMFPLHLDRAWPVAIAILTSAPLFYRFVDGPTASVSSLALFVEGVLVNCVLWTWLLTWIVQKRMMSA